MRFLWEDQKRIISLKQAKRLTITLVVIFLFDFLLFPAPVLASDEIAMTNINQENALLSPENLTRENDEENLEINIDETEIVNHLPENNTWTVKKSSYRLITAYSSEVEQCDGAPCITANGFDLCAHGIEDSIAANFLPFGAKLRIPDLFNDKVFIVRDRMNPRYPDRLDIWMIDKNDAKQFSVKVAKIEILE